MPPMSEHVYDEDLCPTCLLGFHPATHTREVDCPGREPMLAAANNYHRVRMVYLVGATRTALGVLATAAQKLLEEDDWKIVHPGGVGPAWWHKEPFGSCPEPEAVRHAIRMWEREKQALKRIEENVGVTLPVAP